ncbi:hypothetical protein [Chitinophaga pinensis]|uniref:Uncharacterized protein n=1 Tax=Chitinophaga pinensis TaxID=79329 RepID=A0A5C6LW56_9BACT|nr:hypothetical protein [Chitinophaga pinensis]TWW00828.1 hypothetical protein FEF09_10060 [Chitinophaga pinensis]
MKWLLPLLLLLMSCATANKDATKVSPPKTHPIDGVYRNLSTNGTSSLWHYLVDTSHLRIPAAGMVTLTVIDKKRMALSCHSNDTLLAIDTIKCRASLNGLFLSRHSKTSWEAGPFLWYNQTDRKTMGVTEAHQLLAREKPSGIMMALFMPLMAVAPEYTHLYDRITPTAEQAR